MLMIKNMFYFPNFANQMPSISILKCQETESKTGRNENEKEKGLIHILKLMKSEKRYAQIKNYV